MKAKDESTYTLKILRGTPKNQYFEEFELKRKPNENVISALMEIQKNPINKQEKKTTPVVWEQGCLEEVCGSCSMLVNGRPRQSCTALIEPYIEKTKSTTITLAPFTKFPLIRDLYVDRTKMFDSLKKIRGWIEVDGAHDIGKAPNITPEVQEALYVLSTCMTCGCCLEGCPQVNEKSKFIGPAAISQVRLFNSNPLGKISKAKRLRALMEDGGIADCGNAQNCVKICPKGISLTESISLIGRESTKQALKDFFSLPDK
jgi:succinate dehydrogenase iron-sulfur subunit